MKRVAVFLIHAGMVVFPIRGWAIEVGVSQVPVVPHALSSSLIYEHVRLENDFDDRGRVDFKGHVVGTRLSYGLSDTVALAISGGTVLSQEQDAQANTWKGSSGFVYGLDVYNDVFPATAVWPGVQLSAGVSGFQIPFNRVSSGASTASVDQRLSGLGLHGNLLLIERWGRLSPYMGLRAFARSVDWRDNQPQNGQPASIHGTAVGNVSLILGLPVQLTKQLRLELESILINQTALTAGVSWAAF